MTTNNNLLINKRNRAWINNYKFYLEAEQGLSPNSVRAYLHDVYDFAGFISCPLEDLSKQHIIEYLAILQDIELAPSTIARKRSALKSLLTFIIEENVPLKISLSDLPSIHYDHKIPDVLSLNEMLKLLDSIDLSSHLGWRTKAMLELMYASGLRVSETINLSLHDLYHQERVIRVLGKGRKQRVVPVAQKSLDFLLIYLQAHRKPLLRSNINDFIFLNRFGGKISRMGVWKIIDNQARIAGLKKKVSPHTFRHSFATHLVEAGANLRIVQMLLGHASINTTQIYSNIDKSFIIKEHRLYHPRK